MKKSTFPQVNERLRQERIRRNWRQQDLADQLGTTVLTVNRWERGFQQPSTYFRIKLCALFGTSAEELGLLAENPLPPATEPHEDSSEEVPTPPAERLALWTVPYPRNPHFTGRDDLLEHLAHRLLPLDAGGSASTRRAVLTQPEAIKGLGGIGKTQIALEYAYRVHEQKRYTHTLWIQATSEETIMSSFVALAQALPPGMVPDAHDQHQLVAAILRWLEHCQEPWLLIFDNADDLSLIQPYLPHQGHGSVLLTTRAHAVAALASSLHVEAMGIMEGTRFLLHRTQRLEATDEEINEASNVVLALDGFPLALDQAGAYLEETGCGFGDYLHLYQQHRHALLARRGMQTTHYPDSVATTWSLSFQQIEQTNPAAADLLRLCAFLSPDQIPEELLCEGAAHWPPRLREATNDLLTFNQMLEDLLKFSLVKRLVEEHTLSLHRLVQVVQRERMEPEERVYWARCAVLAVNTVFPAHPKEQVATWPQCQRYLEQVQACDLLIQQFGLRFSEAADLLYRAGIYLEEHALLMLAEPLYLRAQDIWQEQLGQEHPHVAEVLSRLALLLSEQGKYAQAERLFLQALRIWQEQLGPEHPRVAEALYGLALISLEQGKYAQAEPLFLQAIRLREQHFGPEDSQLASPLNSLANVYTHQGKYDQAESLYQRALRIREQQWGPEHPRVASPLNNLASLYVDQDKYAQAEPLYQRALRIFEQQLGAEHLKTSYPLFNLAALYMKQGKYTQAEPLARRAVQIRENALGSEHILVAEALNGLASLMRLQENYRQAELLYQRIFSLLEQQEQLSHPEISAEITHDFALLQAVQGKHEFAGAWYERALSLREQVFGPHHPKTQETRIGLLALLDTMGQQESAAPYEQGRSSMECTTGGGSQTEQKLYIYMS